MARNRRYQWRGERPPREALRALLRADVALVTSRFEGGGSALCEALSAGVPVIASRIDATTSLLGPGYPGLFTVGDMRGLRSLLLKAENEPAFLRRLKAACERRAFVVAPAREREARRLLARFAGRPIKERAR